MKWISTKQPRQFSDGEPRFAIGLLGICKQAGQTRHQRSYHIYVIRKLTNFSLYVNLLILRLQEELSFNECDERTIQIFLPYVASY